MSKMESDLPWCENYPEGMTGKITIDRNDVVKYATEWNEYVALYKSGKMSAFGTPDNMQDHIFNLFIQDYGEETLRNQDWGGGASYECLSHLSDLTFKRRLFACMRGQKPFECHFTITFSHMNEWVTYYTVHILK